MQTIHTVVFQAREGGGNPCPVTLDADGLTAEQMQAIAKDLGEEAAFLMRSEREDCHYKIRYFLPLREIEMCIHATIASATVLVKRAGINHSPIMFETSYGPLRVDWKETNGEIQVGVTQFLPEFSQTNPGKDEVCRALGVAADDLAQGPIQSVATSRLKLMVPLKSRKTLDALAPDFEALWTLCDTYDTTGLYPFVLERDEAGGQVIYARQFPRRAGYDEDPATGVAASALGAYLIEHQIVPVKEGCNWFKIMQGFAMGRPSVIYAEVDLKDQKICATRVRGVAKLMDKELES